MNDGQQDPEITAGSTGNGDDRSGRESVYLADTVPDPDPDRDLRESWDANQYGLGNWEPHPVTYTEPHDTGDGFITFRYLTVYVYLPPGNNDALVSAFSNTLSKRAAQQYNYMHGIPEWVAALQARTHPGKRAVGGDRSSEGR